MSDLPSHLHTWMASGRFVRADGLNVWCRQLGNGPDLVCLHGFPTSSWDWHRVLPELARHYRITVFDLPGYGLSEKPTGRNYSLLNQMDAVAQLLQGMRIEHCHVLSHDMGNSMACEWLYRNAEGIDAPVMQSLLMLNGGIYMDLHQPLLTQKLLRTPILGEITARFSSWRVFMNQYPRVYADPEAFDAAHFEAQWALLQHNSGRRVLAKVAGYMKERLKYGERWLGTLHAAQLPVHLVWGERDSIAVPAIAARLLERRPQTTITHLPDVAHYPQLETPESVVHEVKTFLSHD